MSELISNYGSRVDRQTLVSLAGKYGANSSFVAKLSTVQVSRGVYDISGFAYEAGNNGTAVKMAPAKSEPLVNTLSDEDILQEQRVRFGTMERMIDGVISGAVRALIISGPAGIGKTYRTELALESAHDNEQIQYTAVKGHLRSTGLFRLLWDNKEAGQIILLDDSDAAFQDEQSLGILKAALDSSVRRTISWRTEKNFVDDLGEEIPKTFEYKGSIIFISNINFVKVIEQGKSLAPHLAALVSRSFYIDLNMRNQKEYMLRIFDVLENSDMSSSLCLNESQIERIKTFIRTHHNQMFETSLRSVLKLAQILHFAKSDEDFENVAIATCVKRK